jgi:2,4-dienoyl-CoA reductase-like NADH-dependent reductase (Old Yellow Enzyme family)
MWKPDARIDCQPDPGDWPSAAQADASLLFRPIDIGPVRLKQRSWIPAMVPWRATEDGFASDALIDWYTRFARGKPGAIVIEATGIRDIPSGPLLRIGDDRFIDGLSRIVDAVRAASGGETRLFIQLIDFLTVRRRPGKARYFEQFLELTDAHRCKFPRGADDGTIRAGMAAMDDDGLRDILSEREFDSYSRGYRERVTDVHLPHIAQLPQILPELFARAAQRAVKAGFDGVELHYAHAYTMASFLSRLNDREDGYGGSPENRVRLAVEVFQAVRQRAPTDFAVGCRMLSEDCIEGGSDTSDTVYYALELAGAGMDFLSFSRGGKFEDALQPVIGQAIYPYTGPSGYECMPHHISDERGPFGRNRGPVSLIRGQLRQAGYEVPVVLAGGIHGFSQAEGYLAAGDADVIGMARQSLADPDWFLKVKGGHGGQVRQCKYSNYCEGLDQKHKIVTCQLWDREGLDEPGARLTPDGKRRMIAPEWQPAD